MRIGIVDADLLGAKTTQPNLVCMKLSGYYKSLGDEVKLVSSYDDLTQDVLWENRKFDKIFLAKVFTETAVPQEVMNLSNLQWGGTGFFFDKAKPLPDEIEHFMPDYSLYDEYIESTNGFRKKQNIVRNYKDYSIGFTTRGCIRHCQFCVNRNYDRVHRHSPVAEFLDESKPYIRLWDDNILAYPKWREVFEELQSTGKKFAFQQGMDIRLMTDEKAKVITSSKYLGAYIFAFDNYKDRDVIEQNLSLFARYTTSIPMLYLFCGFESQGVDDLRTIFERLKILWRHNAIGYLMRHKNIKDTKYEGLYTNIARWINQPAYQKKETLWEFGETTQRCSKSKCKMIREMEAFAKEYPDEAREWFNMRRSDYLEKG